MLACSKDSAIFLTAKEQFARDVSVDDRCELL